jgi:hypothetical protein
MRLHVAQWIAVSEAVRNHLIIELGVCDERINVVGNFAAEPVAAFSQAEARAIQAAAYGVDARKPWVLAVGNIGPVKAPELFIALAGGPTSKATSLSGSAVASTRRTAAPCGKLPVRSMCDFSARKAMCRRG